MPFAQKSNIQTGNSDGIAGYEDDKSYVRDESD